MFSGGPIGIRALERLPTRQTVGPRLGGVGLSGAIPFVSSRGLRVLCEAIQYRVFAKIDSKPEQAAFDTATRFESYLLGDFLEAGCEPMAVWDWIRSMPSRRRKQLIRAYKSREDRGEPAHNYGKIQAFVKTEKLPFFAVKNGEYGASHVTYVARLIQAPHDETHLDAGRYLKPLVYRLKQAWSWENWLFYASVCPEKLDKWLNRVSGAESWFWADYSSFDATYSAEAWRMLERWYAIIYPTAEIDFWRAIEAWRKPQGDIRLRKDDARITYDAPIMNASGRDDTALANALFNGIALALSITSALTGRCFEDLVESDLTFSQQVAQIAVVGDDSLVAFSVDVRPFESTIISNLRRFGLVVKSQSSLELRDVTFLGMMPYPVGEAYYWGPTLGRRLYKAFWQEDPVGHLPAWTHGVAKQLKLYRHVPVLYELALRVESLLARTKVTAFKHDPNRVWAARTEETPLYDIGTLRWVAERYSTAGLTLPLIVDDIATIGSISRLPAVTRLNTTDAALLVDDL